MKKFIISLLFLAVFAISVSSAKATTIGFDDYTDAPNTAYISDSYYGFDWTNFYIVNKDYYSYSGYHTGVVSPNYTTYNGSGNDAWVSRTDGSYFNFVSAYFSAAWYDNMNITVTGYNNGTVVDSKTFTVDSAAPGQINLSPLLVTFNFNNVDSLLFQTSGGTQVYDLDTYHNHQMVMDNFTFTPAPEPSTLLLGFLSLGGMLGLRRKK